MDKESTKNTRIMKKKKGVSKSQDYVKPSPALRNSPPPFCSQNTPRNASGRKAKKRKLNNDFTGDFPPYNIDSVALVPSSKSLENKTTTNLVVIKMKIQIIIITKIKRINTPPLQTAIYQRKSR